MSICLHPCLAAVVTIGALAELGLSLSPASAGAGNALSALRSVRLLRLLRLARTLVGLNHIITTVRTSLGRAQRIVRHLAGLSLNNELC